MFPSVSFEIRTTRLEPGEILCLFTDGIVEHVNGEKEQFGEDWLAAKIRESAGLPAREIIDRIYDEVISFAGCDESTDDMTLVIVRRKS